MISDRKFWLFMEVISRKSLKLTNGVMLGKMAATDLNGVEANDLPEIKFYTPKGVESLPASFLSKEVGGGLDDLRKALANSNNHFNYNFYCKSHVIFFMISYKSYDMTQIMSIRL